MQILGLPERISRGDSSGREADFPNLVASAMPMHGGGNAYLCGRRNSPSSGNTKSEAAHWLDKKVGAITEVVPNATRSG